MGTCWQNLCFVQGLSQFRQNTQRFPSPTSAEDAAKVAELAAAYAKSVDREVDQARLARLAQGASASLSPMAAFMGGFAGQEVLKAVSGKFTPLNQLFFFDSFDSLPDEAPPLELFKPQGTRYDDQIAVFGSEIQEKIRSLKYFLIGAGAIGCEMLKNWALMGVATAAGGRITVTDMDQIEKSNLNRQFLFRPSDVGKLKSATAAAAAQQINSEVKMKSEAIRVGPDTESVFDDDFWNGLDCAVTALDNVKARVYVDSRCVFFQKPMVDSGTLGTKGNTQVVVPFLTESYSSSRDPPEESIPICTLKNFPNKIEHTIQWARDLFEGLFAQGPHEVNSYITSPTYLVDLAKSQNTQLETLKTVKANLVDDKPLTFDECVAWARRLFESEFNNNIAQLIFTFPPDSLTSQGTKFWSGTKRAPNPIKFDPSDDAHVDFIVAAANLRAFNYNLQGSRDRDMIAKAAAQVDVPQFQPSQKIKIAANDEEAKKMEEEAAAEDDVEARVKEIEQA